MILNLNALIKPSNTAKTIWYILEIADLLKKYGDMICATEGITTQQWMIMLHLAGDPNIPYFEREKHLKPLMASELAEGFNVSRPNITNLLNGLLKKNLIVQFEDEVDRRKKRLKLSKDGIQLLERLEPGRKAFNESLLRDLNKKEKDAFLKYLKSCNDKILTDVAKNKETSK